MKFFSNVSLLPVDQKQGRLMQLAAFFLLVYATTLTLAPTVRLHSWQVEYRWNHWIGFAVWLVGMLVVNSRLMRWLPERDPYLFPVGALLSGWGLLTIWRLAPDMGARQTAWLAVCLLVFGVGMRLPNLLVFLRRYKYLWLTGGLLLTGLTFIFGTYPGGVGPHLWLGCCGIYLQPSEPLKLLLIVYLAAYLADRLPVSFSLVQLLTPTLILVGAALILLVGQRDLGTASLLILIYTVVVYIASQRRRMLVISLVILAAAGLMGYLLFDVVRIRVDAWLDPWLDPAGRSYQIIQSMVAVANGGVLGRGPGLGSPGVVPVSHSDFIFSSIAEETGLLGSVGLLGLLAVFIGRGFRAAIFSTSNYRRYLAAGITTYIAAQAIFIIGGNLRLLPLTGVTLPFVSYGGSSLLTAYISLLILMLISSTDENEKPAPLPNPRPYLLVGSGLLLGLAGLALASGWWALVRADRLLSRPENPRRAINDRYVERGEILDRNNQRMVVTTGSPGSYQREYLYPLISNTMGYNSALYGQAGLEAGLDAYLRGVRGNPTRLVIMQNLLFGQTPPGLDVRLTIDLEIQKQADALLQGHRGALVLLNAHTGEILAISSQPSFDANQLEESRIDLLQDPGAPLINRATQGQYSPGAALGPFLLAYTSIKGDLPAVQVPLGYRNEEGEWSCANTPESPLTPGKLVSSGCPVPLVTMGNQLGAQSLEELFASLGFYEQPDLPLVMAIPSTSGVSRPDLAALGQENLLVTPLQMVLAAAVLSNQGVRPVPQITAAVLPPQGDWIIIPGGPGQETVLAGSTKTAEEALSEAGARQWSSVALARSADTQSEDWITWYLAGTLPEWQGTPLALALVLEERNPELAIQIGEKMFEVINP